MNWDDAKTRLTELRQGNASASEWRESALKLRGEVKELAARSPGIQALPELNSGELSNKARLVRDNLLIGPISLPESVDGRLKQFANDLGQQIISRDTLKELEAFLEDYTKEARDAKTRRTELAERLDTSKQILKTLEAFQRLMDALTSGTVSVV